MRKWSRGLSGWPLTERRGDTYGGQPSVAVDLHGHTAMNSSRFRSTVAILVQARRASDLLPAAQLTKSVGHQEKLASVKDCALPADVRGVDLEDAVEFGLAGAPLPVPRPDA